MKRYTLKFHVLDETLTTGEIKTAVDNALMHLHPRIIYQLRQVVYTGPQSAVAEITSDGTKELLGQHLKNIATKLPVVLESVSWGWVTGETSIDLPAPGNQRLERDPLESVEPCETPASFRRVKKFIWLRFATWLVPLFALIFLIASGLYLSDSSLKWAIYILFFVTQLLLISTNELPLDIRLHTDKINCDPEELDLTYWLGKRSVRLSWDEITGLDYIAPQCVIYSSSGKTRFLLSEQSGYKEKLVILKTIIQNASLKYVEGGVGNIVYRRYDAP